MYSEMKLCNSISTRYVKYKFTLIIMITEIYVDCKEALESGHTSSGIYTINPDEQTPFKVCDPDLAFFFQPQGLTALTTCKAACRKLSQLVSA